LLSEDFPALGWFGTGSQVAGYRLEGPVGAGGMAMVFRALDQRLGRVVALKVLSPALAADEEFRRRFIAESRAAAAVDDPHIIPVYEAGESDGVLFIAMRFVAGGDLRRVLAREGPLPPGRAAGFVSPVASALDAAHRAGLVHRDVKPANILVDARQDRPDHVYLSDFGVSKGAVSSAGLTGSGQFLGTPEYSSPEQVQGRVVDGRADQYALACVAWQLLTGSVPFERDQGLAVLLAHLSEPPPSLEGHRPGLPVGAGQVLARALAKVPEERYPSCGQFADALREALGLPPYKSSDALAPGHPRTKISSEPAFPSPDPTAVSMETSPAETADSRVAAEGGLPVAAGKPGDLAGTASEQGGSALQPDMSAASADRPTQDIVTAGQRVLPQPGAGDGTAHLARRPGRRFLVITLACALLAAAVAVPLVLASPDTTPTPRPGTPAATFSTAAGAMAFGPGGILAVGSNGSIYLWDTRTGKTTATLTDPASQGVTSVAFGPGNILAAADGNGSTYLWDTTTRKITATFTDAASQRLTSQGVTSVAFGPGNILAAADGNGSTYLWDTTTGSLTATLTDPQSQAVDSVAFGPGGILAAGTADGSTYLWDTTTRKVTATLTDPGSQSVLSVAFGPGSTLAAADGNGSTYLWDTTTGSLTATLTDPGSVTSVAFGPGGTLAAADSNGSTYLWDTTTRKVTATLTDPTSESVLSVAFGPGSTLAVGDQNGSTYLWHLAR
jgi:serine/threonine protein kinase